MTGPGDGIIEGDCLEVLAGLDAASVDLIYLDPPFGTGQRHEHQAGAFDDTWDEVRPLAEARLIDAGAPKAGAAIEAAAELHSPAMAAYLTFMAARLVEVRRVLQPTGSLYLHCDRTASHYLKLVLDGVLGARRFRNEVVWDPGAVAGMKSTAHNWIRTHDVILFYRRGERATFNRLHRPMPPAAARAYNRTDEEGRRYRVFRNADGSPRRCYMSPDGLPLSNVWSDIRGFQTLTRSEEWCRWPTQKPIALLDRIIRASSNRGDMVLDPFCGSGTACIAARQLERRYIGIDVSPAAVELARRRLAAMLL